MYHTEQYDDNPWKIKLQRANSVFAEGNLVISGYYYQSALTVAKQLFRDFQATNPLPETLTHTLVISYLNLSDCWAAQNKKNEQIYCLIEIYDFLKALLKKHTTPQSLRHQGYEGVCKVYLELCVCLKEIEAHNILYETEEDFVELSMLYQSQSFVVH